MLHKVIAICLVLFVGCAEEICRRRMELIPGLVWEYYSSNHSRVVSDKYGIIADGMVFITFHDYGFAVSGGDKFAYVDLYRNVLDDSETTHISLSSGSAFRTFDAGYAMGIFAKESYENGCTKRKGGRKTEEGRIASLVIYLRLIYLIVAILLSVCQSW